MKTPALDKLRGKHRFLRRGFSAAEVEQNADGHLAHGSAQVVHARQGRRGAGRDHGIVKADNGHLHACAVQRVQCARRQKILRAFFEYGRLKSLPAQRKKKLVVLEEIVKAFEKNRVYTEREVNLIIADYFDDFCTIRRDMISEGLMERSSEGYWRTKKTDSPAEKA